MPAAGVNTMQTLDRGRRSCDENGRQVERTAETVSGSGRRGGRNDAAVAAVAAVLSGLSGLSSNSRSKDEGTQQAQQMVAKRRRSRPRNEGGLPQTAAGCANPYFVLYEDE